MQGSSSATILATPLSSRASRLLGMARLGDGAYSHGFADAVNSSDAGDLWCSGEIHYFRTPKDKWKQDFLLLKAAGGNCVATYIPWMFLEPSEGDFRKDGPTGANAFLEFLQVAKDSGLSVFVRPGPYSGSELRYGGFPAWLIDGHPEIHARRRDGTSISSSPVSYMHPVYQRYAKRWFSYITELIAPFTLSRGGPVSMCQLDNELTGMHFWNGSIDFNREMMGIGTPDGLYSRYLKKRFSSVDELNVAYGSNVRTFADLDLPPAEGHGLGFLRWRTDYFNCYIESTMEYVNVLALIARNAGIDVPLVLNFGDPSMVGFFKDAAKSIPGPSLLGCDLYYNLGQTFAQNDPTPQSFVENFTVLESLRVLGHRPSVIELQGGSPYDWPPLLAEDLRTWYWSALAYGMKGGNFYMFAGGVNPPNAGTTSDSYDYQAGIDLEGKTRRTYEVQRELGQFLQRNAWLREASGYCDCRILWDPNQPDSAWSWPVGHFVEFGDQDAWRLLRKGMITTAFSGHVSLALCDARADDWTADYSTPMIVVGGTGMRREVQSRIVRFLRGGGRVLLAPTVPSLDERLEPCTILSDALRKPVLHKSDAEYRRLVVDGVENIYSSLSLWLSAAPPADARLLGKEVNTGQSLAWSLKVGDGEIIFLGMDWYHSAKEQTEMLTRLLGRLGHKALIECSNPLVWTSVRSDGKTRGLFLLNPFTASAEATVRVRATPAAAWKRLGYVTVQPKAARFIALDQEDKQP